MNILVIDIGTTSMRGILFSEDGRTLYQKQMKYQTLQKSGERIEQAPAEWKAFAATICSDLAARAKVDKVDIDAVSITAQRSSLIPLDRAGVPLLPAIMWQDSRNDAVCRRLKEQDEVIFRRSGAPVNTVFCGGKIAWIREERPDIYEKTAKFVTISQYITWLMTGEFCTDYTYGSRTNLMNLKERSWDKELLRIFGAEEKHLCLLQEPGSICGRVTSQYAAQTGLSQGIPVISAGGDQQCAAVGQGVYQEGSLSVVTGTGAFLVTDSETVPKKLDPRLICNCSAVKDHYILETNIMTCCSAFDWYCTNFYQEGPGDYEKINRDLEAVADIDSECIVLPYFQGRGSSGWGEPGRALFANVTLSTSRAEMLKALLEGIFMEIHNNIGIFRQYLDIPHAYISGGLTNSKLMNQMQADIYGMPLYHMKNSEATALGALMVTLTNAGCYKSVREAFGAIRGSEEVTIYHSNTEKYKEYQQKQQQMNDLYRTIYQKEGA